MFLHLLPAPITHQTTPPFPSRPESDNKYLSNAINVLPLEFLLLQLALDVPDVDAVCLIGIERQIPITVEDEEVRLHVVLHLVKVTHCTLQLHREVAVRLRRKRGYQTMITNFW